MPRMHFALTVPHPFDLVSTVHSHGFWQVPPFSWRRDEGCLEVALRLDDDPEPIQVAVTQSGRSAPGRPAQLDVDVTSRALRACASLRSRLVSALHHVLDAHRDLTPFYRVCRTYEPLAWVTRARAGRILRCPDHYADVVVSICGTNTMWKQAVRSVHLLSAIAPASPGNGNLHCFPTAAEILRAGADHLVAIARVGYRHRSILALCEGVLAGSIDLAAPLRSDVEGPALREFFRSLPGIGPVTARYLACVHGRADELAVDSLVLRYIGDKYHRGKRPTAAQVEKRYAPFGDHRALAYWFEFLGDVDPVTWRGWADGGR